MKKILFFTVVNLLFTVNVIIAQSTTANNNYAATSFLGWGATSGDLWFKVNNVTQMTLKNTTGYLGLGTTSPLCKLHVAGADFANSRVIIQRSWAGGGWGGALDLIAISNGTNMMSTDRTLGYLNFRGEYNTDANTALGANIIAITTQQWSTTAYGSKLTFNTTENDTTTCTEKMVIDNNGYVGIGTTSPGATLDVHGSSGTTLKIVDGNQSSGKILTSDANGVASWTTPVTSGTAWQLTGNAGTNPSTNFIGTTDSIALRFRTNGYESMRINANGTINLGVVYGQKVTIGYGNISTEQLQVIGNALFAKQGFSLGDAPFIRGGNTYSTPITPDYSWYQDDSTGIFHPALGILAFTNKGIEGMRIIYDKGVCIGTTVPKSLLTVAVPTTSLGIPATLFSYGSSGSNVFIVPKLDNASYDSLSVSGDQGIFWSDNQGSGGKNLSAGFVIAPYSNKNIGIRITSDGNVGIGTSLDTNNAPNRNPNNYKLAVNGNIGAKEVFVEISSTTWPDYVLEKDYSLMTLNELENYIDSCKHLPNIPSANEIKETGIAVGEMNASILKKVEELTLYLIEQNKTINEQQSLINEFKERISNLESEIKQ